MSVTFPLIKSDFKALKQMTDIREFLTVGNTTSKSFDIIRVPFSMTKLRGGIKVVYTEDFVGYGVELIKKYRRLKLWVNNPN